MTIQPLTGRGQTPAYLPQRTAAGSGFGDALRAQVREEIGRALAAGPATGASSAGGRSALAQSLLTRSTRPAPTGPWADTARQIGSQYLSPDVANVFSRQMALESGNFDPDVISGRRVSSAGAEGIAQLMPSSYPNVNRLDPVASLHAAGGTMRANLQQFNGDLRKALAAYNAGGGRVQQAVSRLGVAWEQDLPAETQLYLRELLGNADGR